ncbi:MAG: ABC transporter substrate-binding protein [Giesbergeria sp.]|nr:ABC transporter substrate-binding protein [Giesbergeria sp.]
MPSERRRHLLGAALLLGAAPGLATAQHALTQIRDDLDREVELRLPLRRVVVFNRYTTEFVRAIGAMPAVVGVDIDAARHRAYWPTVTTTMWAGSGQSAPHFEAIVAMRPDAVFLPRNSDWQQAERVLAAFGIPVVVLTAWDLLKHEWNVELLGRLFARPQPAAELNAFYRHWRDELRRRLDGAPRPRVYFEEVGDHRTVLKGSGWHDMVEAGGGINVFGDVSIPGSATARGSVQNFEVDPEQVLERRPDALIKLQPVQYEPHPRAFAREVLERLARRPGFAALPAVREGRVFHISYYLAGGCSKITGALQIAQWLHPQRMKGIEPEAVMGEWLQTYQGVPAQSGYALSLADLRG